MGQKLLVQEAPGSGSASTNRMEGGEGAGGGELHHFLQYNQQSHSPSQSLQGGLPLPSPQPLRHDGASSAGIVGVKREPEDLSSSRGGQQPSKRHKQAQPDSPTPPGMYHHHQLQVSFIAKCNYVYLSAIIRFILTFPKFNVFYITCETLSLNINSTIHFYKNFQSFVLQSFPQSSHTRICNQLLNDFKHYVIYL